MSETLEFVGLPVNHSKDVIAGEEDACKSLSLSWWRSGHLKVRPSMSVILSDDSMYILSSVKATPPESRPNDVVYVSAAAAAPTHIQHLIRSWRTG